MTKTKSGGIRLLKLLDPIRKAYGTKKMQINTIGSMIPFANARGQVLLVVYCIKSPDGKPVAIQVPQPLPRPVPLSIP
jgi:hypothetical protein